MFIVQQLIDSVWVDRSSHTLSVDADVQKQRFIDLGTSSDDLQIVEKDTYDPPYVG